MKWYWIVYLAAISFVIIDLAYHAARRYILLRMADRLQGVEKIAFLIKHFGIRYTDYL